MTERNKVFDLIRALAIIWIVCIWHLANYFSAQHTFYKLIMNQYGNDVTIIVLAIFTFLSGLFLGQKKIEQAKDYMSFYKKRISRFYFLFLISCITLFFTPAPWGGDFIEGNQLLLQTITGFSCFTNHMASTLWYMDMILFFYILTPLILSLRSVLKKALICLAIWLICFALNHYFHIIERRIIMYMPYFLLGLLIGPYKTERIYVNYKKVILLLCIFILIVGQFFHNYYYKYLYILAGISLTMCVILNIRVPQKVLIIGSAVSYASMSMYLFHRQIYAIFYEFDILILVAIPIIVVVSFAIQKSYDYLLLYLAGNE